MKIHSDVLTTSDLRKPLYTVQGVFIDRLETAGSRSRARAFDVHLAGEEASHRKHRTYDRQYAAATYDEWGYWLAALFAVDPEMLAEIGRAHV